jgi:hypothetical protein
MGWKAGDSSKGSAKEAEATSRATGKESAGTEDAKSKRGIWLILGGLVLTGVAAGWSWLRRLPKD